MSMADIRRALRAKADPAQAKVLSKFFKTGKGQYGEGDMFLGIKVPVQREIAKAHCGCPLADISRLLDSKIHEERLTALLILTMRYEKADAAEKQEIYDLYIASAVRINNWDLVDLSAPQIVGAHLMNRDRSALKRLAASKNIWERRIAIVSTLHFIRNNDFSATLEIAEKLVSDSHDLIRKAVGWMLREVGKRDPAAERSFLDRHCRTMPRTMLRYAIEKFPEPLRQSYLRGDIPAAENMPPSES